MMEDIKGLFGAMFMVLVFVSCVLVLTDAAADVFTFWFGFLAVAIGLYAITIPFSILMWGINSLLGRD